MHIHEAHRRNEKSTLNIPFLGSKVKYKEDQGVYVINKESQEGIKDPLLLPV